MAAEEIIGTSKIVSDKPFKFEGVHFKCWQQSEVFLTIKNVVNILIDDIPIVPFGSVEQTKIKKSMNSDEIVNFNESGFTT